VSQCLLRYLKCVLRLSQVSCGVWMCLTGSKHVYAPDPCGCGSSGLRSLAAARPASTACETRVCMQYRSAALTKRWCVGWKRVCVRRLCDNLHVYRIDIVGNEGNEDATNTKHHLFARAALLYFVWCRGRSWHSCRVYGCACNPISSLDGLNLRGVCVWECVYLDVHTQHFL